MAFYPRKGSVRESPGYQVDGFNSCPICDHINLDHPTSQLKVNPTTGKPFTLTADGWSLYPDINDTFPTYGSWFCIDNGHIFRTPSFHPKDSGFTPAQSGMFDREF